MVYAIVSQFYENLCDAAKMSCEVAALSFQAHANYGTLSIDFGEKIVFLPICWCVKSFEEKILSLSLNNNFNVKG